MTWQKPDLSPLETQSLIIPSCIPPLLHPSTSGKEKDVSIDFTSILEVGERIVLRDTDIGPLFRLLLTNRRLVVFEGEDYKRNPRYSLQQDYPLTQIEEAYADGDGFGKPIMKVRMKDGNELECSLSIPKFTVGTTASQRAPLTD